MAFYKYSSKAPSFKQLGAFESGHVCRDNSVLRCGGKGVFKFPLTSMYFNLNKLIK